MIRSDMSVGSVLSNVPVIYTIVSDMQYLLLFTGGLVSMLLEYWKQKKNCILPLQNFPEEKQLLLKAKTELKGLRSVYHVS